MNFIFFKVGLSGGGTEAMAASRSSSAKVRMFDIVMLHKAGYLFTNVERTGFTQVQGGFSRFLSHETFQIFAFYRLVGFVELFLIKIYSPYIPHASLHAGFWCWEKWGLGVWVGLRICFRTSCDQPWAKSNRRSWRNERNTRMCHRSCCNFRQFTCHSAEWDSTFLPLSSDLKSSVTLPGIVLFINFQNLQILWKYWKYMKLGGHIRKYLNFPRNASFHPQQAMKLQTSGVVARKLKSWCTGALLKTCEPMSDEVFEKISVRQDVATKHPAVTVHTDSAYKEHMLEAQQKKNISGALRDSGSLRYTLRRPVP